MSEVVYRANIKIERQRGPFRLATLPATDQPVEFGVHSEIAAHYGVEPDPGTEVATTLDYVMAATGG